MDVQGLKGNEIVVCTHGEKCEVMPKPQKQKPDSFVKNIDVNKVVLTGGSAATGLIAGKKIGGKIANGAEKIICEFMEDFGKTVTQIPQSAKGAIKWGTAGMTAILVGMGLFKDADGNKKADVIEALNTILIGESADITPDIAIIEAAG